MIGSGARARLPDEALFQPNILFKAVGAGLAVPVVSAGFSEALALALALADLDLSHDGIKPETRCMLVVGGIGAVLVVALYVLRHSPRPLERSREVR